MSDTLRRQRQKKIITKIDALGFLQKSNSGIILMVVLWLLVILTTLAVGLGRRTSIDLALTKHALGRTKSYYTAFGGLIYAMSQISEDKKDPITSKFDTLYQCAVTLQENQTMDELFKDIPLGEGSFSVYFTVQDQDAKDMLIHYGLRDEDSKININATTQQNHKVLRELIKLLGVDQDAALTITYSIIDWKDQDTQPKESYYGAEDEYYLGLQEPYKAKNAPLESLEELLLIKGMTPGLYAQLEDFLTIYPKATTGLKVNVHTASQTVLRALFRSVVGPATNTIEDDADSLAAKIVMFRRGIDGVEGTPDDRQVDSNEMNLNAKERTIFLATRGYMTDTSRYIKVQVRGIDQDSGIGTDMVAIVDRDDLTIVGWKRN
ncbi:MAG: hypothetical protein ABIJ41_07705 [Candidatus Omnitrophota bacterium]